MNTRLVINCRKEKGAVLVLSLLILSIVMFSAISLVSILISDLKSARFLDSAITAHYAAESGAEQSLFYLKEAHSPDDSLAADPNEQFFSPPAARMTNVALDMNTVVGVQKVPYFNIKSILKTSPNFTAYNIPVNNSVQFDLFDPAQETGGASSAANFNSATNPQTLTVAWEVSHCGGSDKLEITQLTYQKTGGDVRIFPLSNNPKKEYPVCGCSSDTTCVAKALTISDSSLMYHYNIRPIDDDVKSVKVTLANAEGVQVGIPSQIFIQSEGRYGSASQLVTVQTPWNNGLAGIFDYVIFSEASLIKNVINQSANSFQSRCGYCDTPAKDIGCSGPTDCGSTGTIKCLSNLKPNYSTVPERICSLDSGGADSERSIANDIYQTDGGSCNARCTGYTFCGDHIQQTPNGQGMNEECDDGNSNVGDLCSNQCKYTTCGDGFVQKPNYYGVTEVCDWGDPVTYPDCPANCLESGGGVDCHGEVWVCTDWGTCIDGVQRRQCTDQRHKGTTYCKPPTTQLCYDVEL